MINLAVGDGIQHEHCKDGLSSMYIISSINYSTGEVTYEDGGYDTISEIERRVKNGETVHTSYKSKIIPPNMDINDEIEKLKNRIKELEKEKQKLEELPVDKQLALFLHKTLCTHNHTDGCGWYYENDNWDGEQHKRYLAKAKKMIGIFPNVLIIKKLIEVIA